MSHDLLINSNADRSVGDQPHYDCQGCRYRNAETNQKCAVCGGWKEKYAKQRGNTRSATSAVASVHCGVTEQQGCSVAHGRVQQAMEIAKEQDMCSAANHSRQRPLRGVDTAAGKITQRSVLLLSLGGIMQQQQQGMGVAPNGFDNPALAALLIGEYQNEAFLQHQQRQLRTQQHLTLAALGRGIAK